jgi:hypothetical protein
MAITRSAAQRLCTQPEFELFEASMPANARQLTPGRLRQKVERARRLRDKYRDLAKRQRLEARGKRAPQRARPAAGNENTVRKAELFDEVLQRFQRQLERATATAPAAAGPAARKPAAKKSTAKEPAAKKSTAKEPAGKKSAGKKSAGKESAGKKSAGKKLAAKKSAPKKSAAQKSVATRSAAGPAAGGARTAEPAQAGATAARGARSRPGGPGVQDAKQQARGKTAHAHGRAANRRGQQRRDRKS